MAGQEEEEQGGKETDAVLAGEELAGKFAHQQRAAGVHCEVDQLVAEGVEAPNRVFQIPEQGGQRAVVVEVLAGKPLPNLGERRDAPGSEVVDVVGEEGVPAGTRHPEQGGEEDDKCFPSIADGGRGHRQPTKKKALAKPSRKCLRKSA